MSKIFTWLFGAITGFFTCIVLVTRSMVNHPKEYVEVAESFIEE